jgi:hypothetical protein
LRKKTNNMTQKIVCYIEFNYSGNFMRIVHKSGMWIGEFMISDTNLRDRAIMAHDRLGYQNIPRPNTHYLGDIQEIVNPDVIIDEIRLLQELLDSSKFFKIDNYREVNYSTGEELESSLKEKLAEQLEEKLNGKSQI